MFVVSRNFPGIFGNQQQHYLEVIKRMLVQCMQDQENPQVSTRRSLFNMFDCHEKRGSLTHMNVFWFRFDLCLHAQRRPSFCPMRVTQPC